MTAYENVPGLPRNRFLRSHLTSSYCAMEVTHVLKLAREEAERICGPLSKRPFLVTDNGSSFIARRFVDFIRDQYSHVRIQYRTPHTIMAPTAPS